MDYRVIKENDLFLLTDIAGDIPEGQRQGLGLYAKDTRFLSRMELRINSQRPNVLASEADQNYISTILLMNPHMEEDGKLVLWRESIELRRTRFIYGNVLYETIKATNFSPYACSFEIPLRFDADFQDMFVVRGFMGGELGKRTGTRFSQNEIAFGYLSAIRSPARRRHGRPQHHWSSFLLCSAFGPTSRTGRSGSVRPCQEK
jgi:glycogen debranching enzyme